MKLLELWQGVSNRWLYALGMLAVCGLMGFGFYLQYVEHEEPCPLCMVQRAIYVIIGLVFAVAMLHGPRRTGQYLYAGLLSVLALSGVAVAARHIWLQNLPPDQVPACGPGLDYMLETLPMAEVLQKVLHGSGECAEKGWTFLMLGIPEWSLLTYLGLMGWALLIAMAKK